MRLAPGTPLAIGLLTEESATSALVGRLAMAQGLGRAAERNRKVS